MRERLRRALSDWLANRGVGYRRAEQGVLALLAAGLTGGHAVQVGIDEHPMDAELAMVAQHVLTVDDSGGMTGALHGHSGEWPLQADSVRMVLVHHAHELVPDGESVFREAARVLKPGGVLLAFGFEPLALSGGPPAETRSALQRVSARSLHRRLDRAGMDVQACHAVIAGEGRWADMMRWMDRRADCGSWLAALSGGYGLRARKRDAGAPIFDRRNLKGRAINGAVTGSPAGGV